MSVPTATAGMLNKVVAAARGFDLIEIEGDAAFLSWDTDHVKGGTLDVGLRQEGNNGRRCAAVLGRVRPSY